MKKFLSLVLALVMTMSLVTLSAGAKDFTDDSKIQYKEAVDVVSALEIVDGYKDGSFNPSATLTRGAAAKIICNLILGPTTASALVADTAPYSDVPTTNDFAGYIAYCAQQGIISGYADGTFRPAGTLTSYAFMKMLLGALGYDAEIEGYIGSNWSVAVAKQALGIDLDDDLVGDFNGIKAVTREEACLYAFNTLKADMVSYDDKTTVSISGAVVTVGGSRYDYVSNPKSEDYRKGSDDADSLMQFCEKYFSNLKLKSDEARDDFGRPANTWYKKNDKIGTYAKAADLTYTKDVKGKDVYKDLDLSKAYTYDLVVDGLDQVNGFSVNKSNDKKIAKVTGLVGLVGNGSLIEVFEDEQVVTVVNTYLYKVDGDYDEDDEELTIEPISDGLATPAEAGDSGLDDYVLSADDFDNLDSFKDGDYALITAAWDDGVSGYVVKSIEAAEVVTGTVTEYVDDDTVTAGGTEYSYNVTAKATDDQTTFQYELKEEANLYVDKYGYVLWAEGVEDEKSYVYVEEFSVHTSSSKSPIVAMVYFLDGTDDTIDVNKVDGTKVSGPSDASSLNATATGWYRYSKKDSGKYDLTPVDEKDITEVATITDYESQKTDIGTGTTPAGKIFGNKNTKFIVVDEDDDVDVYTGIKNAPETIINSLTQGAKVKVVLDGNSKYAKYVFIDVGSDGQVKGGNVSSDQLYILKLDATYGHEGDSNRYYRYKAILNGEEKKVKIDDGVSVTNGTLYDNVKYDSNGYIIDASVVNDTDDYCFLTAAIDSLNDLTFTYKNNTLYMSDGTNFYLADDAKIFYVIDKDDVSVVTGSKLVKEVGKTSGLLDASTIYGVKNADDEFTSLFIYNEGD